MEPKICMITGANSGIGKAAAIQIAQQGHHVIMACRSQERGATAMQEVKEISGSNNVDLMIVDMGLQSSIEALAEAFRADHERIDVLIQNAAIFDVTQKEPVLTDEGIESVWATNHLGPVLLTDLLWSALKNSPQGRVITIASKGLIAKPFLKVDLEDPEFKSRRFSVENAYYQSKLAQIMYTYWLADKGKPERITANCIRVPAVKVDVDKYSGMSPLLKKMYAFKTKFALEPEEMAVTYTTLATLEKLRNITGQYFDEKMELVQPRKYAKNPQNIEAVMKLTIEYLKKRS